jgi:tetratricopeptide (TPR) repeat protein
LGWLLNKNEQATFPMSYYYLGRSLWDVKEYPGSALSMELYLAAVKGMKKQSPLVADAYYIAASARQGQGDRKAAIALLEAGLKIIPDQHKDQFLYKMGELAMLDGRVEQSRSLFERVIKEGKDPDWQRLARQALEDSKIIRPTPPPMSKKK